MNSLVCIYTGYNHQNIILQQKLLLEGITSIVKDEFSSGLAAGYANYSYSTTLWVKEENQSKALHFIESWGDFTSS